MITVRELIKALEKLPPETIIEEWGVGWHHASSRDGKFLYSKEQKILAIVDSDGSFDTEKLKDIFNE